MDGDKFFLKDCFNPHNRYYPVYSWMRNEALITKEHQSLKKAWFREGFPTVLKFMKLKADYTRRSD